MTLREMLGDDVGWIHEQVDALLDREDAILALFNGDRVVTYALGFGASASQLELLSVDLERALNNLVGRRPTNAKRKRRHRERNQSSRSGDGVNGDSYGPVNRVLRLANKTA
jgi:hypothetical protein